VANLQTVDPGKILITGHIMRNMVGSQTCPPNTGCRPSNSAQPWPNHALTLPIIPRSAITKMPIPTIGWKPRGTRPMRAGYESEFTSRSCEACDGHGGARRNSTNCRGVGMRSRIGRAVPGSALLVSLGALFRAPVGARARTGKPTCRPRIVASPRTDDARTGPPGRPEI
jgi:hypothetical protein